MKRARNYDTQRSVNKAKCLAHRAHAGQVDKAGRPYIEHVTRVAAAVADDPKAVALAWLHDVAEDCQEPYPALACDLLNEVALADELSAITFTSGITKAEYYKGIRRLPIALRVKLADIADNADEARLALLDEATAARLRRKYANARRCLRPNG